MPTESKSAWIKIFDKTLNADQITTDPTSISPYLKNSIGAQREVDVVLRPQTTKEIVEIVGQANKLKQSIYPISTGKNWGYGAACPVKNGGILLDLSGMDKILDFDRELGTVTLEPGVTQEKLFKYIQSNNLPFLVPVHGGGPDCSIIGNALERGYGITPNADHFSATTQLEAVLPDGSIYNSALSQNNGKLIDSVFKWGLGPYIDGLFTQSNIGIVTKMTVALEPIPEKIYNFFFWVDKEEKMESAVSGIKATLREVGANCGSINLMNQIRILSMMEPFPRAQTPVGQVIPKEVLQEMAKRQKVTPWMGAGAIYANKRIARATKAAVRKKLGNSCKFMLFLSPETVKLGHKIAPYIPGATGKQARTMLETIEETVKLISGGPSEVALPLSYWRSGKLPQRGVTRMDPAQDGCGIIWYSPLIPMQPQKVREFVEMVKSTCIAHGIDPLITLTSLSDKVFDSTIPLLFERSDEEATRRADKCYRALFEEGKKIGVLPYRMGINHMDLIGNKESSFWKTVQKIKTAIDPNNVIAPGRYEL